MGADRVRADVQGTPIASLLQPRPSRTSTSRSREDSRLTGDAVIQCWASASWRNSLDTVVPCSGTRSLSTLDRAGHGGRQAGLQDHAEGTGGDGVEDDPKVHLVGQDEHLQALALRERPLDHRWRAREGGLRVHQQQLRLEEADGLEDILLAIAWADHLVPAILAEQRLKGLVEERLAVGRSTLTIMVPRSTVRRLAAARRRACRAIFILRSSRVPQEGRQLMRPP